jgi:transposase-like protein
MIQGLQTGGTMGRKPRVDRTAEEKWQIVQEGMKSGNVSETCRRYGIAQTLYYRWKDEAEQGAKAALGGEALRPRRVRRIGASDNWNAP